MKRNKKVLSRRQKTFCQALLLVLLLVVAMEFHLLCLTPNQTIRATEDCLGLSPTEPVLHQDSLYLSENKDVLLLTVYQPGLWRDRYSNDTLTFIAMDKPDNTLVVGGGYWYQDYKTNRETFHLIGEVFLDEAVSVRAYCGVDPSYYYRSVELTADVFTADNGRRYFWSVTQRDMKPIDQLPFALEVLDRDGNVLYTYDSSDNWTGDHNE